VERCSFFGNARRMLKHPEFMDQFISFELMLAAERIRVGAFLNIVVFIRIGLESGTASRSGLIDKASERGNKDLPLSHKRHRCFSKGYPRMATQFRIDGQQMSKIIVDGDRERINDAGRNPDRFMLLFRGQNDVALFRQRS
jgi:hypothetical protein